ncbi:Inositol-pentakisphosphate 2-kinase [Linnemannia zychae]|nr:Inositol-pentakisphosphate 2-kinase [Linnemannia zychae]
MATILELYRVDYWQYRAEGNANIVLQYIGPHSRFRNTVLRLRKADRLDFPRVEQGENSGDNTVPLKNLSSESHFASKVIGLLLGPQFVEQLVDHPAVAVEIKPKWGFLTKSAFIATHQDIKRRKCRFCMYQHQKVKTGQEGSLSKYCPIDLFSEAELLVQDALDSLVETPQNNLRLFINGNEQPVSEENMNQSLGKALDLISSQDDGPLDSKEDGSGSIRLTEMLTQILIESPLLRRLSRLQQALDSLDVETIHQMYSYLVNKCSKQLPEPTVEEFLETAEAFMDRTDMDAMMMEDRETFEMHNAASIGFEPEDELEDVPESLQLHFIREFLLSATLKDCSILISIQKDTSAALESNIIDETASPRPTHLEVDESSPEFSEACHRIKVKGEQFVYKITCIDLDPKKMTSVPMYLKKDRGIIIETLKEHWYLIDG